MIRQITGNRGIRESVAVLRASFRTVAEEFGLTEENCPANPAFVTLEKLDALRHKGATFFGLFEDTEQIGFVALEKATPDLYYLERLAVVPQCREKGHGTTILDFACDYVKGKNGKTISIGIMDNSTRLKSWYRSRGFVETGTRQFDHLPFVVCFMDKNLAPIHR
jgi:ribosomal protein S18 acetylase RimI-like enzyme